MDERRCEPRTWNGPWYVDGGAEVRWRHVCTFGRRAIGAQGERESVRSLQCTEPDDWIDERFSSNSRAMVESGLLAMLILTLLLFNHVSK